MISVFRLEQKRFVKVAGDAYTGFGARQRSARWHKRGLEVVYTSESRSLCAMEVLTQCDPEDMPEYVCVPARIPKAIFDKRTVLDIKALPPKWRSYPPPSTLAHIGSRWLEKQESALLDVPSALIPEERNYMLNPQHSDFKKIIIGDVESFTFDLRLLK